MAEEQDDIQKLVDEAMGSAQSSLEDMNDTGSGGGGSGRYEAPTGEGASSIDLLHDVDLDVTIELGRTQMLVEDVLRMDEGSVVELDKLAGDPVDVYVNNRLVARGEVLVLNENFCVRVSEIVGDLEEEAHQAAEEQAKEQP